MKKRSRRGKLVPATVTPLLIVALLDPFALVVGQALPAVPLLAQVLFVLLR